VREFEMKMVEAEKEQNNKRRMRLGQNYFERGEYAKAISYLEDLPIKKAEKLRSMAEIKLAEKNNDSARLITIYDGLVSRFPDEIEYASWVLELIELNKDKGTQYVEMVEK